MDETTSNWDQGDDDFFGSVPTDNSDLLQGLNPSQQQAVQTIDGPLMIIAGPGSGKTRVVTHRIANMIRSGVDADRIIALTFTNKAADEMKSRLASLIPGHYVWAGTFHRFCAQLLRQYAPMVGLSDNFSILDVADSKKVMEVAWAEADIQDDFVRLATVQKEISKIKNAMILPDELTGRSLNAIGTVAEKVYPIYQKTLLKQNAVDFDDLLLLAAVLLKENEELRRALDERFQYMSVDEYQDTNLAQYAIVRALSQNHSNLSVTGDPDQSIYGWRGANAKNILNFEKDFPNTIVVKLEHNYRSKNGILQAADRLISRNTQRKQKRLIGVSGPGAPVRMVSFLSPNDEADFIASEVASKIQEGVWEPKDIAVLYRANWLSRNLERSFHANRIPFQLVNGYEFYQRKEIRDLLAYLRLLHNPKDNVALERVINTPSRKIGKVTVQKIRNSADSKGISMLDACRLCGQDGTLAKRSASSVAKFVEVIDQLAPIAAGDSVKSILVHLLELTGYRDQLIQEGSDTGDEQVANIDELLSAAQEFDNSHPEDGGLNAYLESASLASDTDKYQQNESSVKLMTMHASKGLEFPCVYIVGLEEGIVPHERSREDRRQLEEERRLLFVGVTRAEEELTLSRCEQRMRRGFNAMAPASSFLQEFPLEEFEIFQPGRTKKVAGGFEPFGGEDTDFDFGQDHTDDADWVDQQCQAEVSASSGDEKSLRNQKEPDGLDIDSSFFPPENSRELIEPESSKQPQVTEQESGLEVETTEFESSSAPSQESGLGSKLMTASAMMGDKEEDLPPVDPSVFKAGMLVTHPKYGPGKIVSLTGTSTKPSARVKFISVGEKTFRLKQSAIRPVGKVN